MTGLAPLMVAALFASGCATVINRSPGDVSIATIPDGADVQVDDLPVSCQTPCDLEVKPDTYDLHITKAGYKPETVKLVKRMAVSFWFNFVVGPYGVIGMGIDWLSGSIHKISPSEVRLKLVPLAGAKVEQKKPEEDEDEAADEEEPAKPPPPPAPALEADSIAPETEAQAPEPPLPPTAETKALVDRVPDEYVDHEIELYYGQLPAKKQAAVKRHLYQILLEMQRNGDRADIDEAVRTEKFRYP